MSQGSEKRGPNPLWSLDGRLMCPRCLSRRGRCCFSCRLFLMRLADRTLFSRAAWRLPDAEQNVDVRWCAHGNPPITCGDYDP